MRPPRKAGGNRTLEALPEPAARPTRFNEAPAKSGGEPTTSHSTYATKSGILASMRPPRKAGGNTSGVSQATDIAPRRFNEAPAKSGGERAHQSLSLVELLGFNASMRPPRKAGGNQRAVDAQARRGSGSMRPPRKAGGNLPSTRARTSMRTASMRPPRKAGGNREPHPRRAKTTWALQ